MPRKLNQANHTYTETCGSNDCYGKHMHALKSTWTEEKHAEVNERRRQTNLKLHGVEFTGQREDVKEKIAEANHVIVTPDGKTSKQVQQEKTRQTKLKRHGYEFFNNSTAIRKSKKAQSVERKNEIIEKRRETCLERYGVSNQLMRPEIISKNAASNAKLKTMTLPSGRVIEYQGYEGETINRLLENYDEEKLILSDPRHRQTCEVPFFSYVNVHGNRCRYYPDIFIPSENRIIEVKSRWWYDANGRPGYESRLENNRRKQQAALDGGYRFEFWVFDSKTDFTVI
jgi:hypothetical protein